MKVKTLGTATYGTEVGLRPGAKLTRWPINFVFNDGGLGDFVNYAAVTVWVAKNCPWVEGRLHVPRYLVPLMREIHDKFPRWKIFNSEEAGKNIELGTSMIGSGIKVNGVNITPQYLTVLGAHPIDVAFGYYAGSCPAPADLMLPMVDFPRERLIPVVKDLNKYAVVTTGNTTDTRRTTGKQVNPIVDHIIAKGLTPVFLGKTDLLMDGKQSTRFADDIDYSKGVDLRDKTTIKEAACILQHAEFTVGLDNGLLHLAALMKDSKIIFGYNITTIAHREPRRDWGVTINITLSEQELQCIGCQSKLKNIAAHTFDKCIYGDVKCVELLYANNSAKWIEAIDLMLSRKSNSPAVWERIETHGPVENDQFV